MRPRTLIGILVALLVVVAVSYLSHANIELLEEPFQITETGTVPVYVVLIATFLLGFLPVVTALVVQTLRRDLALRRERRFEREAETRLAGFRRAIDLQEDGQWSKAVSELESLLAERPEDFSTLLRYGRALRLAGRPAEAVEAHRRASVLYPQSGALLYELAADYEANGEPEVAEQVRERLVRDFPNLGLKELRRRRRRALEASSWAEARQLQERIENLLAVESDEALAASEAELRRGLEYEKAAELLADERVDEARAILRGILERHPHFVPAYILLGDAADLEGDDRTALEEWRRGWEATRSPTILQRLEDHFIERENPMAAIETLHGLMSPGDDLLQRYFLGRLYHRLEMHREATKTLEGIADRVGRAPGYHHLVARLHLRGGDLARAVEALERCIGDGGLAGSEYVCSECGVGVPSWEARCASCGAWGTLDVDFEPERVGEEADVPAVTHGWNDWSRRDPATGAE